MQTKIRLADDDPDRLRVFWTRVWLMYRNELRMALRERNTVINSVLLPILLYPALMWVIISGMMFVQGRNERLPSRVQVTGLPAVRAEFEKLLKDDARLRLVETAPADGRSRVRRGDLDVLVEFLPAEQTALAGDYRVRLTYNRAKDRSAIARDRVREFLDDYRADWLQGAVRRTGVTAAEWTMFSLDVRDTASETDIGAFFLSITLPMIFVVMVAVGCFYPAIDTTAGERERQTWEALMTLAVPRTCIVTAKLLTVTTFGWVAGLLNVMVMTLTMKPILAPLFVGSNVTVSFSIPAAGLPVIAAGTLLLAAFIAAGMMLFAVFARTFKDGQAMITPIYLLAILPAMAVQGPDVPFTLWRACLPVANVAMVVREAIAGVFHWPQIGLTAAVSLGMIALCIHLAALVLRAEDVLLGSYDGSLWRFFTQRVS